jgi:hypothetical protein
MVAGILVAITWHNFQILFSKEPIQRGVLFLLFSGLMP